MNARRCKAVVGLFLLAIAGTSLGDETAGGWGFTRGVYSDEGKFAGQDFTIYTTADDQLGAAFRCNNGKLFAILSMRPLDIKYWMSLRPGNAETRRVSFAVDGGSDRSDEWISIFHGRLYMSTRISSTNTLYKTALSGGRVQFNKRKNQSVEIELPPGDEFLFDQFLESCELLDRHHPFASEKTEPAAEVTAKG